MSIKQAILSALENNRGRYISGAELASELGVSRTAVWKGIAALKADGTEILSRSGSGYMLPLDADTLTEQGIEKYLVADGVSIKIFKCVDSTNNVAKRLAAEGCEEGTVVVAHTQSGGKGRLGRKFHSPEGAGIYMSLVLRPEAYKVPMLTVLAAVAVADGIERAGGKRTQIKWVNDVFADSKKCCGILTEAVADLESGGVEYAVVGIGVNVYEPKGGFAEDIKNIASAACEGVEDARNKVVAEVINAFFERYNRFDKEKIAAEYKAKSMLIGRKITVIKPSCERSATAIDIDGDCRLIVEYEGGERETLSAGEVSLRV
ncbi:MAG: biotin--[acetyl-CoA-carboxylase] ligase [Bacteroides sp.]|nr:biotin--[acetyl-CoA-carboxylase] ligase [Bacillota bacterium]MCM1455343.1 biotin--[acetyl-CoA-carboxylase] ligase [Bacteroides sp.]